MPDSFSLPASWHQTVPPIIVVVGQSGAGKSDFINLVTGKATQVVGHTLASETTQVTPIDCTIRGKHCGLIDCPGFDDTTGRDDVTILDELANFIGGIDPVGGKDQITGILFLHRVSDNRFTPRQSRIARVIANICGQPAMKNAVICTTHWDTVSKELGEQRLTELRGKPGWSDMVQNGTRIVRHSNKSEYQAWAGSSVTPQSNAQDIICDMLKNGPVPLRIIEELKSGTKLADTAAGRVIEEEIRQVREQADREIAAVQHEMKQLEQTMERDLRDANERVAQARREADAAKGDPRAEAIFKELLETTRRNAEEQKRYHDAQVQLLREEIKQSQAMRAEADRRFHELASRRPSFLQRLLSIF